MGRYLIKKERNVLTTDYLTTDYLTTDYLTTDYPKKVKLIINANSARILFLRLT